MREKSEDTPRKAGSFIGLRVGKRSVVRARKLFCQLAVLKMGYSGAGVARYLGVTTSSVNRLTGPEESAGLDRTYKLLQEPPFPFL